MNDGPLQALLSALLVEDDDVLRRVLSRSLRVRAEVDEAGGAIEALEKLRNTSYDLIIIDADLPDGGGPVLVTHAREDQRGCQCALLVSAARADLASAVDDSRIFVAPDGLAELIYWVDSLRRDRGDAR